jgi:HNH endonuclease
MIIDRTDYNHKWYVANKARKNELSRKWLQAHPEKAVAAVRRWEQEHPEQTRAIKSARRARKRGAFTENVDFRVVFERDAGICGICALPVDLDDCDFDHIIPLGPGDHSYENVRVTHASCNRAKSAQDRIVLAQWRIQMSIKE